MASSKRKSETELLLRQVLGTTPKVSLPKRILGFLARRGPLLLSILGALAALAALFGAYFYAIPEIDANNSEPSSVLPFIVKNRSRLFDMTNVKLSCGIELAAYEAGDGKWVAVPAPALFGPTKSVPVLHRHGGTIDYPCNASDYVYRRNIWGDLCFGTKSTCGKATYKFKTSYMCVWVRVDYHIFSGWLPRHVNSPVFSWNGRKWTKGSVARERFKEPMCGTVSDFN